MPVCCAITAYMSGVQPALSWRGGVTKSTLAPPSRRAYEAAKTTAITASYEKKRAHDALCDAIDDSQVDTWNARSHKAVRLAELKAVLAEGHTLMERMRLKVTQNKQKDITAITGDMATTTWEDITMEEATTEQNTFTKRLDAAEVRKTEAEDEVEASFLFTEFLLEGCRP